VPLSMREFGRVCGPALLLLHGAGKDHATWQSQIDHLSDRYRILAPDLPGCGESPGPFDLGQAATAVAGHLEDASAVDRVHVCGLSLGAMVGLQMAATRPELVASLVLSGVQLRPPALLMAAQLTIMQILPRKLLGAEDPAGKRRVMDLIRAVRHVDLRDRCASVQAPTLVLCGARDRANLGAARRAASLIPHATLEIIPRAGHQWNIQFPVQFSARVSSFVDGADN
jgi:3-oxoadipate enol-lactonase